LSPAIFEKMALIRYHLFRRAAFVDGAISAEGVLLAGWRGAEEPWRRREVRLLLEAVGVES